jgi:hypothetical protein
MAMFPHYIDPPLMIFSALPLALFVFKILKLLHLYSTRVGASLRQTLAAAIAGLALSHTIGLAVLQGLFTRDQPFFRTPKRASNQAWLQALADNREEGLIALGLWLSAAAVYYTVGTVMTDLTVWIVVLLIQSIPYTATLIVAVISAFPGMPARYVGKAEEMDALAHVVLDESRPAA